MFTVCPKCALTLVVTAADLRIAQGYVRCGRCLNVFNALARLSEERPAATAPAPDTVARPQQPVEPPQSSAPAATFEDTGEIEIELDASVLVTSAQAAAALEQTAENEALTAEPPPAESLPEKPAPPEGAAPEAAASPLAADEGQHPADRPDQQPTALAQGATASPPGAAATSGAAVSASTEASKSPEAAESAKASESTAAPESAGARASAERSPDTEPAASASAPQAQQTNTAPPQPESAFELEQRRPRAGLAWRLGAGALAIALALQIVNHYRDDLAAISALERPLTTVYSALGVKLAPPWNIHAYEVHQLGASVGGAAAGEIVVRASVKNSASRAQPLPLLRVTLQDRFGNRIAARDVPPGDYLPSPVAPGSLLAAGSRVDATMVFVDPGPQAVGFEIDACLREGNGAVACAHGP